MHKSLLLRYPLLRYKANYSLLYGSLSPQSVISPYFGLYGSMNKIWKYACTNAYTIKSESGRLFIYTFRVTNLSTNVMFNSVNRTSYQGLVIDLVNSSDNGMNASSITKADNALCILKCILKVLPIERTP